MRTRLHEPLGRLATLLLSVGLVSPLAGQSIALKTVPIATGEQYLIFPSRSLGMGGLSIAYDDPLGDAFANPARGARLHGAWLVSAPTTYGGDDGTNVGGHTLPIAFTFGGRRWFGTGIVALQEVRAPEQQQFWWWPEVSSGPLLRDDAATNTYVAGSLGRTFDRGRTSIGIAAYRADLNAVDGVGQLYANSMSIAQSGTVTDYRLGVLRELGGERRIEGMVGRSDVDMTHDVLYVSWTVVDPVVDPPLPTPWQPVTRTETNLDRTTTWSGSLRYTAPTGEPGVRWGLTLIGNRKSHPHIPNYDLVQIPRDPGNSTVFGIGTGVTSRQGGTLLGAELMFLPGRSHTWAFADSVTTTLGGGEIPKGEKTVDNEFRYANWTMALGMEHEWEPGGMELGLRVNRYGYHLDQQNFLRDTTVATSESWIEWSPSWGGFLKLGRAELHYTGRWVAKGFDFPGGFWGGRTVVTDLAVPEAPGGNDFVVAPTDPVNMPDFRVVTHRLMIVVPLSARR